jgi:hypothetical protein
VTETDLRALVATLARIEMQVADMAATLNELRQGQRAPRDAADRRLAEAMAESFGRPFGVSELIAWVEAAPTMPSRRRVADAVRDLVGEVDAQRLGIALGKSPSFERVGSRGGCAVWMPLGIQGGLAHLAPRADAPRY